MSDPIIALATANTGAMPTVYSSMKADTMQEKAERFNAISDPKHRIGDMINQVIWVKDVFVEIIELARTDDKGNAILDETGAPIMDTAPRIVLIDKDGDTYQAVAMSVLNQLKRLFNDFGEPTWEPAIPIEVKQRSIGTNRVYTFVVRGDLMQ